MANAWQFAHLDGFDKYGVAGASFSPGSGPGAGDWTTTINTGVSGNPVLGIANALSGSGGSLSLSCFSAANNGGPQKGLPGNYQRCTGTMAMQSGLTNPMGIMWQNGSSNQFSLIMNTLGRIEARRGGTADALIATSAFAAAANSTHTIGWDVTFNGSTGVIKVYVDGVIDANLNLTGQNTGAANQVNGVAFIISGLGASNAGGFFDHYYGRYYTSPGGTDPPPLSNPRIETDFPTGDQSVAFTPTAGVLGSDYSITGNTNAPGANQLALRKWTPVVNGTLNSISIMPEATSSGANFKPVVYADSGGAPAALLSSGSQVTGCTSGTLLTLPLTTPQSLTAATPVWIGYITDTSVVLAQVDTTTQGYKAANTYGSGAPGTAPSMTAGQPSWIMFGNLTGMASNWPQVSNNFSNYGIGTPSYNASSTVGAADFFDYPSVSGSPPTIVTSAVKAFLERSDSGARTMNLQMKSGSTTGNGDNAGFTAGLSFGWAASFFDVDPNTSAAWTLANLNAAFPGYQIAS